MPRFDWIHFSTQSILSAPNAAAPDGMRTPQLGVAFSSFSNRKLCDGLDESISFFPLHVETLSNIVLNGSEVRSKSPPGAVLSWQDALVQLDWIKSFSTS